eukprot:scaffold4548_cov107-Isochrysis_galbana.AAC.2
MCPPRAEGCPVRVQQSIPALALLPLEDGEEGKRPAGAGWVGGAERGGRREEPRVDVLWQHAQLSAWNALGRQQVGMPGGGDPQRIGAVGALQLGGGEPALAHHARDEPERSARVRRRPEVPHQARVAMLDGDGAGRLRGRPLMVRHLRRQVRLGLAGSKAVEKVVWTTRLQQVQLGHMRAEQGDQPEGNLQPTWRSALWRTGGATGVRLSAPRRRSPRSRSRWGCATRPVGR